ISSGSKTSILKISAAKSLVIYNPESSFLRNKKEGKPSKSSTAIAPVSSSFLANPFSKHSSIILSVRYLPFPFFGKFDGHYLQSPDFSPPLYGILCKAH